MEVATMPRIIVLLLALFCNTIIVAQSNPYASRDEALKGLAASDAAQRAEAVIWIATNGTSADAKVLQPYLVDENPIVRQLAEQGLWALWSRSGDKAIDALMEKGAGEIQARQFKEAIATYSEVIRRKPAFAEGWNKRATVLFLAGDLKKSLADCNEVMKRNPYHFGALAGYGQIYFQLKEYDKAIAYWKRALVANPNMTGVETNIEIAEQLLAERRKRSV
jgi:tetratricopeptide (TPR) repeat protein